MQTFLPLPDFEETARLLDWRRLGKQRSEANQILHALEDPNYGWQHHPAVRQWRGFSEALKLYKNTIIQEWVRRGYKNTMTLSPHVKVPTMPPWLNNMEFHLSHQSNLLRKNHAWYAQYDWGISPDRPYLWPYVIAGEVFFEKGRPPSFLRKRRESL